MYMTVKIRPRPPHCEASKSQHTDPVGFLRTSDQLVAEDATYITQQTQRTIIRALSGIPTRDPSNQAAADICLIPHGQRDRLFLRLLTSNYMTP